MDEKKFRKISKKELLEILLAQAKRIEELELELDKAKEKLNSRKIAIDEAGSIAEAALKLNNIFEVAQATAKQYLFNVEEKCKKMENYTKKECRKREREADKYIAEVELKVKELLKNDKKNNKKKEEKLKGTVSAKTKQPKVTSVSSKKRKNS